MTSLADHVNVILAVLSIVFGIALAAIGFITTRIWMNIDKLHMRIDEFFKLHYECQKRLPIDFVGRLEFKETWEKFQKEWHQFLLKRDHDWEKLWDSFNNHKHNNPDGRVVR